MSKRDYYPLPEINHYGAGIYDKDDEVVSHTSVSGIWTPSTNNDGGRWCPACLVYKGIFNWVINYCGACHGSIPKLLKQLEQDGQLDHPILKENR